MANPPSPEDFGAVEIKPTPRPEDFGAVAVSTKSKRDNGPVQNTLEKAGNFIGEGAMNVGSGLVSSAAGGLSGILGAALPGPPGQGADWAQRTQDLLSFKPRTPEGQTAANITAWPFEKLAQGADWAGGVATDLTGSPAFGTAINTGIQALPMAVSGVAGRMKPITESPAALAQRTLEKSQNSGRDAVTQASKDAGLKMTPTEVNPSAWNQLLEGISGQAKNRKTISLNNEGKVDNLARQSLGLKEDAPLTDETFDKLRVQAGKQYEIVRNTGRIESDPEYGQALQKIISTSEGAEASFPTGRKDPVYGLVESLNQPGFTASAAVDKIQLLRADAEKSFRQGDARMGKAYKQAALALEDAIDRHLQRKAAEQTAVPYEVSDQKLIGNQQAPMLTSGETGVVPRNPNQVGPAASDFRVEKDITPQPEETPVTSETIDSFRKAREIIARSYNVQAAMDGTHVSAVKLADQLKRGKPLGGELKTLADFGKQFPKSAQMIEKKGYPVPEALDLAIGGAAALHNPMLAAGVFARPLIRHGLASDVFQKNFVNPPAYGPDLLPQNLEALRQFQAKRGIGITETSQEQQ